MQKLQKRVILRKIFCALSLLHFMRHYSADVKALEVEQLCIC